MTGHKGTLDDLFSATYEELRRLAASVGRLRPGETMSPTVLVNEAYVKLARTLSLDPESRLHFKRIAARAMRQVLVEAARHRSARKRGGGRAMVTLDESMAGETRTPEEILALDAALEELAELNPRQSRVVEYRFFGGLDVRETAELLEVSESTVERDWRAARAWMAIRLA